MSMTPLSFEDELGLTLEGASQIRLRQERLGAMQDRSSTMGTVSNENEVHQHRYRPNPPAPGPQMGLGQTMIGTQVTGDDAEGDDSSEEPSGEHYESIVEVVPEAGLSAVPEETLGVPGETAAIAPMIRSKHTYKPMPPLVASTIPEILGDPIVDFTTEYEAGSSHSTLDPSILKSSDYPTTPQDASLATTSGTPISISSPADLHARRLLALRHLLPMEPLVHPRPALRPHLPADPPVHPRPALRPLLPAVPLTHPRPALRTTPPADPPVRPRPTLRPLLPAPPRDSVTEDTFTPEFNMPDLQSLGTEGGWLFNSEELPDVFDRYDQSIADQPYSEFFTVAEEPTYAAAEAQGADIVPGVAEDGDQEVISCMAETRCTLTPNFGRTMATFCVKDIFGRNKAVTKAIKRPVVYCRKHAKKRSLNCQNWDIERCSLARLQMKLIEEHNDNPLYDIEMFPGEVHRLKEYVGLVSKGMSAADAEKAVSKLAGSDLPRKAKTGRVRELDKNDQEVPVSVLRELRRYLGSVKSRQECEEVLDRIEEMLKADETKIWPGIMFVPRINQWTPWRPRGAGEMDKSTVSG